MLDLRRLRVLQQFSVTGSITATAAELGFSPSAISQQLSTLEREAGVALIERTAQRAILTDAGRELAEHAVVVFAAVETAQSRMRERAGTVGGRVEVSCIPGLAPRLAPHLAALQAQHPELSVVARETESGTAAASVLDGVCDLAVVDHWPGTSAAAASGLTVHELYSEPVVLALPSGHPAAGGTGRTGRIGLAGTIGAAALREVVEGQIWLCAPPGQLSRTAGDAHLRNLGIEPVRRWEFQGLHVLAALVAEGVGVALLPASICADQPTLVGRALRPAMRRRIIALTRTSRQQDPALAHCLAAARQALRGQRR